MIFDRLFSNKSTILILREIAKNKDGISNSQIARNIKLSKMAVSKTIKELEIKNIIKSKVIGSAKLSELNPDLSYSNDIKDLFNWETAVEEELFKKITQKLLINYPDSEIVLLFGSRARKEEKIQSDMDIMILSQNDKYFNKTDLIEGFLVSHFHLSTKEFVKRLKNKDSLILNVYFEGKVLKGAKEYAKLVQ